MQLLLEDGRRVEDFVDIPFDARKLYLVEKDRAEESFEAYKRILKEHEQSGKRQGFIGRLRHHFRCEIVPNKYDEISINYHADFNGHIQRRKDSVFKAMQLLERKKVLIKNAHLKQSSPSPSSLDRPQSRESLWREENVEDGETRHSNEA